MGPGLHVAFCACVFGGGEGGVARAARVLLPGEHRSACCCFVALYAPERAAARVVGCWVETP